MCCTVPEEYVHRKSVIQPFWTRSGKIIFYGFVPDTHAPGGIPYDNDSVQDLDGLEVAFFFFYAPDYVGKPLALQRRGAFIFPTRIFLLRRVSRDRYSGRSKPGFQTTDVNPAKLFYRKKPT